MWIRTVFVSIVFGVTIPLGACTKPNQEGAGAAASAPSAATPGTPNTPGAPDNDAARAVPDASPAAADTSLGQLPRGGTSTDAATAAPCGNKPNPDCPLQAWMKSTMNPPVMRGDTATLAKALEKSAALGPPGYPNWASISRDGAKAAQAGDLAAAKASCRACHDQYKQKYRTEDRARPLP